MKDHTSFDVHIIIKTNQ